MSIFADTFCNSILIPVWKMQNWIERKSFFVENLFFDYCGAVFACAVFLIS